MKAEFCVSHRNVTGKAPLMCSACPEAYSAEMTRYTALLKFNAGSLPGDIATTLHPECHRQDGCVAYLTVCRQTRNTRTADADQRQNPRRSLPLMECEMLNNYRRFRCEVAGQLGHYSQTYL